MEDNKMCCLFGFYNYSGRAIKGLDKLTNMLAHEATERGTDATGISYNKNNRLITYKRPESAFKMNFQGVEDVRCVIGHTRHATQGRKQDNCNNHPFIGNCQNNVFALAHNGVLFNDTALHTTYKLPYTRIQTDSYIAVQLLEHFKTLNNQNIKKMCELLRGSYCFSILDNDDVLYLVKGDNPLHLIHFPKRKLYVYASTDDILFRALIDTMLFDDIQNNEFEMITFEAETILQILPNGDIISSEFVQDYGYSYSYGRSSNWYDYGWYDDDEWEDLTEIAAKSKKTTKTTKTTYNADVDVDLEYLEQVKAYARYAGYEDDDVDYLLASGCTLDEVAEMFC